MSIKLEKVYKWRYLTEDGLLKEHPPVGPYYDKDYLLDSYDTEEDAIADLVQLHNTHGYSVEREMVLLTVYRKGY